jgi:hypothetical protein
MRISLSVQDPSPEFQKGLLALLSEHGAGVEADTGWNSDSASRYYFSLPANAQRILREAASRSDGFVPAEALRGPDGDAKLTGHSAFQAALKRGVRLGWWPEDTLGPVVADGPGFGKVVGYRIRSEALACFRAATAAHAQNETTTHGAALAGAIRTQGGEWNPDRCVQALHEAGHPVDKKAARGLLRKLRDDGEIELVGQSPTLYRRADPSAA